jgi:hypothetical protein
MPKEASYACTCGRVLKTPGGLAKHKKSCAAQAERDADREHWEDLALGEPVLTRNWYSQLTVFIAEASGAPPVLKEPRRPWQDVGRLPSLSPPPIDGKIHPLLLLTNTE